MKNDFEYIGESQMYIEVQQGNEKEQNFEEVIKDLSCKYQQSQIELQNEKCKTKSLFQILDEHKNSDIAKQLQHAEEQILEFSKTEAALMSLKEKAEILEAENLKLKEKILKFQCKKKQFKEQISYLENEVEEIKQLA